MNVKFLVNLASNAYNDAITREGFSCVFHNTNGSQAFSLLSPTEQIIVFRGTDELRDLPIIVQSHEGFMQYARNLLDIELFKSKPLTLVGHSLGGAVAVCFASLIDHPMTEIVSFGCPKVGDANFVKSISHIPHKRYVNYLDYVTWLPLLNSHHSKPIRLQGFKHHIVNYIDSVNKMC